MAHQVTLIPGDGIGPEVADAAARAVDATGVKIDWERVELNAEIIGQRKEVLPVEVLDSREDRPGTRIPPRNRTRVVRTGRLRWEA